MLSGLRHKYDDVRCAQFGLWRGARRAHPRHGAVTDEQRSHRPNSAQPGGRQVFFAQTSLLAPHRSTARYARRSRLVWAKNPSPRTSSYLCLRPLRVASMIAFIAALLGLGNWACRGQTPTERSARPLRFTPGSGPIEGGRFVFIDVEEPAAAIGTASIACQFGQHAASPGKYDATSARYLCRTPAHSRPESVTLTITLDGAEFQMPVRYVYTTHGKSDAPVTEVDIPRFQQQVKRVQDLIPRGVKLCAVLKNGEPVGWLAEAMARAATVDYFCLANAQDGIALREAAVKEPIMGRYLTEASYA